MVRNAIDCVKLKEITNQINPGQKIDELPNDRNDLRII